MQKFKSWSLIKNRSVLLVLLLGFSSGLPLSLSLSTLQAWFTVSDIPVTTIGWLTLLGIPYTYKFIWAPLLDRYYFSWLGRRRGWLFITQLSLLLMMVGLSYLTPQQNRGLICIIALSISFISATQDVVVDAYRTEVLKKHDQGIGSAVFVMGYRVAMLISGGLALIIADKFGWHTTFLAIAALMLLGMIATYLASEPKMAHINQLQPNSIMQSLVMPLLDFWKRPQAVAILSFIILYKFGEAFAVSLGSNFLINGIGFSLTEMGAIYKTFGLIGTLFGAYSGGLILNFLKLYRSLFFFGILQALALLLFVVLAMVGKNYPLMISAVFAENLGAGMATCALMVFIMRLCNKKYTAAQYALFAAFSAIGRVVVGPFAGFTATHYSWAWFFFIGFILTIPGLVVLYYLNNKQIKAFNGKDVLGSVDNELLYCKKSKIG